MATPLLDHEVLRLNNSNYMELLVATFQHQKDIRATNYSAFFEKLGATIHIENSSSEKILFNFRSDNVLSCSCNLIFKEGNLDGFTYTIKPASYFKKRITKKQYQRIIAMFAKISEVQGSEVEVLSDEMVKFHFAEGVLTVTGGAHMLTGTMMVTVIFDRQCS